MNSKEFIKNIVSLSPRIYPMVLRLLQSDEDAQDAVQEIMIRLWSSRKKLASHPNPEGYVFLTTRNYCLDQLKKKRPENREINSSDTDKFIKGDSRHYEQDEIFIIINQIINDLPENQKEIVLMRDLDGLEFDEITALTGVKIENVRVILSRARKKIGERLTKIYNYEYGTTR